MRFVYLAGLMWGQLLMAQGYIEIKCPPGARIFLDGDNQGLTTAQMGGLLLDDVSAGPHRLKATKRGFHAQTKRVTVVDGRVLRVVLADFAPSIKIEEHGASATPRRSGKGSLLIQSLPIDCEIIIPELGIDFTKKKDKWVASTVPAGRYEVEMSALGNTLYATVEIRKGKRAHLFANFLKEEVVDKGAKRRRLEARAAADEEDRLARIAEEKHEREARRQAKLDYRRRKEAQRREARKEARRYERERIAALRIPTMVNIAAGSFWMGYAKQANCRPVHQVALGEFAMSETEVTVAQFEAFLKMTGRKPPRSLDLAHPRHPVRRVSWYDAKAYCDWLSDQTGRRFDLPTEAQWEYACRAGSNTDSPANLSATAWYANNSGKRFHDVGTKQPNAWGLYDMQGNVTEWCRDWADDNYYKNSPKVDPTGPSYGTRRASRGSTYSSSHMIAITGRRYNRLPDNTWQNIGFRIVEAKDTSAGQTSGGRPSAGAGGAALIVGEWTARPNKRVRWVFRKRGKLRMEVTDGSGRAATRGDYFVDNGFLVIENMQGPDAMSGRSKLAMNVGTKFMLLELDGEELFFTRVQPNSGGTGLDPDDLVGVWNADNGNNSSIWTFDGRGNIKMVNVANGEVVLADYSVDREEVSVNNPRGDGVTSSNEEVTFKVNVGNRFMCVIQGSEEIIFTRIE